MKYTLRLLCTVTFAVVAGFAVTATATPPTPLYCECADIDAPVICSNGHIYPNQCVADCFRATGCVPYNP